MNLNPHKSIMLTRCEAERIADALYQWADTAVTETPAVRKGCMALLDYVCKEFRIDWCNYCESHQDITEMRRDPDNGQCCASCYAKHIQKGDRP